MSTNETKPLEVGELAQRAAVKPEIITFASPDGVPGQVAFIPQVEGGGRISIRMESVDEYSDVYRARPLRRQGAAQLFDIPSLIDHINRFKDADSVVFASTSRGGPSITAVLDYHKQGSDGAPRFGQHRSLYTFPISDEWAAWINANGKGVGQADFAAFIEARLPDVIDPTKASDRAKEFAEKCGLEFASP